MSNKNIPEMRINTWEQLKEFIDKSEFIKTKQSDIPDGINIITNPVNSARYFRGVKNASYRLQSTLERYIAKYYRPRSFNRYKVTKKLFEYVSSEFLNEIKKNIKSKIPEKAILLNDKYENEIWFYGQHYGLSTPFLDWTKSFFIALYFAFEERENDEEYRAVYCLNNFLLRENKLKIYEAEIDIGGRLTAQKGVFTKILSQDFENLNVNAFKSEIPEVDPPLTKLIIKSSLRKEIIEFLLSLNIDSSTIYPDINGAIKNCHLELDNILEIRTLE